MSHIISILASPFRKLYWVTIRSLNTESNILLQPKIASILKDTTVDPDYTNRLLLACLENESIRDSILRSRDVQFSIRTLRNLGNLNSTVTQLLDRYEIVQETPPMPNFIEENPLDNLSIDLMGELRPAFPGRHLAVSEHISAEGLTIYIPINETEFKEIKSSPSSHKLIYDINQIKDEVEKSNTKCTIFKVEARERYLAGKPVQYAIGIDFKLKAK